MGKQFSDCCLFELFGILGIKTEFREITECYFIFFHTYDLLLYQRERI